MKCVSLADELTQSGRPAGVKGLLHNYPGAIHGFASLPEVAPRGIGSRGRGEQAGEGVRPQRLTSALTGVEEDDRSGHALPSFECLCWREEITQKQISTDLYKIKPS